MAKFNVAKAFIVSDKGVEKVGIVAKAEKELTAANIAYEIFDEEDCAAIAKVEE